MFSYKCIFILYCKDALNTGDCLTNNALKYDGPLLICRDSFSQDWLCLSMYVSMEHYCEHVDVFFFFITLYLENFL